jgi:creatinine amidohydrolase
VTWTAATAANVLFVLLLAAGAPPAAAAQLQLDSLTWMEVRDAMRGGSTTILIPVVPEAAGHMRFPGTIPVSGEAFTGIVTGAARSLRQHGCRAP